MPAAREHEPIDKMEDRAYRAFLVRAWQEPGAGRQGKPAWRFTLVQLDNGQNQLGFGGLDDLVAYLRQALATPRRTGRGQP